MSSCDQKLLVNRSTLTQILPEVHPRIVVGQYTLICCSRGFLQEADRTIIEDHQVLRTMQAVV
jgi:hypothetical protein